MSRLRGTVTGAVTGRIDAAGRTVTSRAKAGVRAARDGAELRRRHPGTFGVDPHGQGPTRVVYLCPDESGPSGGVQMIYRHVAALTELGVAAMVAHQRRIPHGDGLPRVPVAVAADLTLTPHDVLVVSEWFGPTLHLLPPQVPLVVFNQGPYYTFTHVDRGETTPGAPYDLPQLRAILTVSDDGARLMSTAFPDHPVLVARPVVDAVFEPRTGLPQSRLIYIDRERRTEDRELVLHMLRSRDRLGGVALESVRGSRAHLAERFADAAGFLAFGEREGFGLPTAEAIASGCHAIGFAAGGGAELFGTPWTTLVPEGDVVSFVHAVEEFAARWQDEARSLRDTALEGSSVVRQRYSMSGLTHDLEVFLATIGVRP